MVKAHNTDSKTIAVLGAFCFFLATLEYMIPKPLPFIRLGLANIPLLLALNMPFLSFITLAALKVIGQALISGTLFSYVFLFSAAGTAVSALAMFALNRLFSEKLISLAGISTAGAVLSNIMQIILARFFILGDGALFIAPPLLAMGIISGFLLGLFAGKFTEKSLWYKKYRFDGSNDLPQDTVKTKSVMPRTDKALFFAGLILAIIMLFTQQITLRIGLCVLFWLCALIKRKAGSPLGILLFFFTITAFNLISPYGKVIMMLGAFPVTEGALLAGLSKAAAAEGLILFSRACIPASLSFSVYPFSLISESLSLLHRITEEKNKISAKNFIGDIDALLIKCCRKGTAD